MNTGTRHEVAGESRPIRVLVAEDSVVMRSILRSALTGARSASQASYPVMKVCGMAADGVHCLDAVRHLDPDVLLLDIEMPRMGGLGVLDELRSIAPGLPVIMCSASTESGANATLDALARGAADYVTKPSHQTRVAEAIALLATQLLPRIAALHSNAVTHGRQRPGSAAPAARSLSLPSPSSGIRKDETSRRQTSPHASGLASNAMDPAKGDLRLSASALRRAQPDETRTDSDDRAASPVKIIVIGVSTGGPTALEAVLPSLPRDFPVPVVIVQHMPAVFTHALTHRLRQRCALDVKEAQDGAELKPGAIWIAKSDWHLEVCSMPDPLQGSDGFAKGQKARGPKAGLRLRQTDPEHGCRPAVDRLFHSAAVVFGPGVLALVMTGMGADGLEGSRAVLRYGGTVLAQDEATSAVWGMPRRVAEAGLAARVLPLGAIAAELSRRVAGPINAPNPANQLEVAHGVLAD